MSRGRKRRGLCSSLCKGRVAFDCRLHPFVRRRRADLNEMICDLLSEAYAHLVIPLRSEVWRKRI